MKPQLKMTPTESIVGGNACTMCLYNVPRSTLMVTLPGLVIFVSGAAMTAVTDHRRSWTDGLAMVALVCLILGGVWTVGGLIFWLIAWWRFKPKSRPGKVRTNMISAGYDNQAVQLEDVTTQAADISVLETIPTSTTVTNSGQKCDIRTNSDEIDACKSVPDEAVYSVRL